MAASPESTSDLPAAGSARECLLPGAAGDLEAIIASPREAARGFAVICHPHPLFGGAMSNKVAYTLASVALHAGFYALRFNFRGVGRSQGVHDQGIGETDDIVAMVEWLRQRLPAGWPLLLAGFSFGGAVSLRAAAAARPALQISVAPPLGGDYARLGPPAAPPCPWLVIHSRDDDVVAYADTSATVSAMQPTPSPTELATVDGAGHFFNGRLGDIQQIAGDFINRVLP